jgi:hypothetical protein
MDIKHQLKKIRNNIASSLLAKESKRSLVHKGKAIVWSQWESAYEWDKKNTFQQHFKLTDEHFLLTSSNKMRNKLAEQVLDSDMLALMKAYQTTVKEPEQLSSTIELLEQTSFLVDFAHSQKPMSHPSSPRHKKLLSVQKWFKSWEIETQSCAGSNAKRELFTRETRQDLDSCVLGFSSLLKSVSARGHSIVPARVNSDAVEIFFCMQRGVCNGLNTNPTYAQYATNVNGIILTQTTVSKKSNAPLAKVSAAPMMPPVKQKKTHDKENVPPEKKIRA